jgi:hypothetical protein
LVPSDFRLFSPPKNHLGGKRFADDEKIETERGSGWDNSQKTSMLWILTHW